MKRRAERLAETRRRIIDATVALHEELGPARTTVAAIAERAGVSRPTVYNQFPDDSSLFSACSARFAERRPFPRLQGLELEDALRAQYAYCRDNTRMLEHVERDAATVPALARASAPWRAHLDRAAEEQAARLGLGDRPGRAALRLAFQLGTWQSLARSGLAVDEAAALMAGLVRAAR